MSIHFLTLISKILNSCIKYPFLLIKIFELIKDGKQPGNWQRSGQKMVQSFVLLLTYWLLWATVTSHIPESQCRIWKGRRDWKSWIILFSGAVSSLYYQYFKKTVSAKFKTEHFLIYLLPCIMNMAQIIKKIKKEIKLTRILNSLLFKKNNDTAGIHIL